MISFCICVYNRWSTLRPLLTSMSRMTSRDYEVLIADLGSTDVDLRKVMAQFKFPGGRCRRAQLAVRGKINRSAGRNMAVQMAAAKDEDILFFLDADMLVPPNFCELVQAHVGREECFFPICYSLHRHRPPIVRGDAVRWSKHLSGANGWWRKEGWGNCGFLREDYARLGDWNEVVGRTYGGEDNNIRDRARELFTINRFNCDGFFHQWHSPNQ